MGRSVSLIIPGDPLELSPNARLHPYVRRKKVREWKARTFDAWEKAGRPRLTPPVRIRFTVRRERPADIDNLQSSASLKGAVDSLTDRHSPYRSQGPQLIPDDRAGMVWYGILRLETGAEWRDKPEVLMHVEEIG